MSITTKYIAPPIHCFILFVNVIILVSSHSYPHLPPDYYFSSSSVVFLNCVTNPDSCFLCENVDFRPVNISKSQVGDLKCDCCDGSDEKPNTCKNTCRSDAIHYVKNRITNKRNIQEGLEIRSSNIRRAHRRISSWKNDLKYLRQDYRRLQKLREKATKRRYLELAIERFEAEILYDAEDEEEKEREKNAGHGPFEEKNEDDVQWIFKNVDGKYMAVREEIELSDEKADAKASVLEKYKQKLEKKMNMKVVKVNAKEQEDEEVIDLGDLENDEEGKPTTVSTTFDALEDNDMKKMTSSDDIDDNDAENKKQTKDTIIETMEIGVDKNNNDGNDDEKEGNENSKLSVNLKMKKKDNRISRCELTPESGLHNGGKRIERAKFIVNGNDTLSLIDFLNSETFMPVGENAATKAKWRDEGSLFLLTTEDLAVLVSGDPPKYDQNKYHTTVNYRKRHGFMGKIFNGGKKGWNRGVKYIVYAIGFVISPIRIVYELLKFAIYIVNVALNMIPKYTEMATVVSTSVNNTRTKINDVIFNSPTYIFIYQNYRALIGLPLWLNVGIPIRRIYRHFKGPWFAKTIWEALPVAYAYLFPYYKESHKRTEVMVLEECLELMKEEDDRLNVKITNLNNQINMDYGPHRSHFELSQNCYKYKENDGTYDLEFCPFYNITMSKNDNTNKQLIGKWYGWEDLSTEKTDSNDENPALLTSNMIYRVLWYKKGDKCDANGKENVSLQAVVNGICGAKTYIENVIQINDCFLKLNFRSPAYCESYMIKEYDDVEEIQNLKKKHFSKRDEL